MKLTFHPHADRFDRLEGVDLDRLVKSIKRTKGNKILPILYRVKDGKAEGLDGRNRLTACRAARVKPTFKKVVVADEDVVEFIDACNVVRRHDSAEKRQQQVKEARERGLSIREIAEKVGASATTVQRDIEATGATVPGGTVVGKDGRGRTAKRTVSDAHEGPVLCPRCTRIGKETPPAGADQCPGCVKARAADAKRASKKGAKGGPQKNGQAGYDWRAFRDGFGILMREIDKLGKLYGAKEHQGAEKLRESLERWKGEFTSWHQSLTRGKAAVEA